MVFYVSRYMFICSIIDSWEREKLHRAKKRGWVYCRVWYKSSKPLDMKKGF